jgi:ELWxxDGT repeat protein
MAGTVLVKDIVPGPDGSNPTALTNVNGWLVFQACEPGSGCEIWVSDGTADGTRQLADIVPGGASARLSKFTLNGSFIYVSTEELPGGHELWAIPMSALGQVPAGCAGDCNGDGAVSVAELITMVNIALGNMGMPECEAGDGNDDGQIAIDEILKAVNSALNGCPMPDVSGTRQRDQAAIVSSTCAAAVTERVQSSIDAGEWNCTYDIAQSGATLTVTETCPEGTDTFSGTVNSAGRITVVRTEQKTQSSCTFTQTSRFEANGTPSTGIGTSRLQFDFSAGCAFTDCEMVVESRFTRL